MNNYDDLLIDLGAGPKPAKIEEHTLTVSLPGQGDSTPDITFTCGRDQSINAAGEDICSQAGYCVVEEVYKMVGFECIRTSPETGDLAIAVLKVGLDTADPEEPWLVVSPA